MFYHTLYDFSPVCVLALYVNKICEFSVHFKKSKCFTRGSLMTPKGLQAWFRIHKHMIAHTGEKPYICLECDKALIIMAQFIFLSGARGGRPNQVEDTGEYPYRRKACFNISTTLYAGEKAFKDKC